MSEQLLTLFKFGLLAVLYIFFARVLWAVWSEVRNVPNAAEMKASGASSKGDVKSDRSGAGFAAAVAAGANVSRSPSPSPAPVPPPSSSPAAAAPPVTGSAPSVPAEAGFDPAYAPAEYAPAPMPAPDTVPVPTGRLVVREPADDAGMQYQLDTEVTVGRAAGCGICIDDTFVSQLHARVFRTSDGFYLEDLGSTNGTFHNTHRLGAQRPEPLVVGDYVQFGSTVLEFV